MRPYWAIVKDAFREALGSPVLWIALAGVTLLLGMVAPIGFRQVRATHIAESEVADWEAFIKRVQRQAERPGASPGKRIWSLLEPSLRERLRKLKRPNAQDLDAMLEYNGAKEDFRQALNALLVRRDFDDAASFQSIRLGYEGQQLQGQDRARLTDEEAGRLNRLLVEAAFADLLEASHPTQTIITYAGFALDAPLPLSQEQLQRVVGRVVNTASNWFIGGIGILVAILITAPIIPRMFDQGQLHLLLSKPASRSLLLVAQFLGGCAYIAIIAAYLVVGLWLVLGLRFGMWDARLLWLVAIYTFAFAIYYCVSVAAGVVYRNTIVSIAASMLFWLLCFSLGTAKVMVEELFLRGERFNQIVPAGGEVLAASERNVVHAWNAQHRRWDEVFLSEGQRRRQAFAMFLPPQPPMLGPVYDPERQEILGIERPLAPGMPTTLGVGRASESFAHHEGVAPPMGSVALFREPRGTYLVAASMGLFRVTGDPLKQPEPVKMFGMTLPLPPRGPFADVSPEEGLLLPPPAAAAMDAHSGELIVYARGQLSRLVPQERGRYRLAGEASLEVGAKESLVLGYGGGTILVGRSDGRVQAFDATTLRERSTHRPERHSAPRFVSAAPDGQRFAVLFHNGVVMQYDPGDDAWSRLAVTGQGDISAIHWSPKNELWLVDRAARVSVYDGDTLALQDRLAPRLSLVEQGYYYALRPLYTVFPKPGEMYKTFEYVLTGQSTTPTTERGESAAVAQAALDPWAPIWSGALFIAIVLLGTCVYFERQEY